MRITWNTLHVLQGQNAVIFNVKPSDATDLYRVKHETVIAGATWSNKYLHRIYEQDHFGRVHFKGHITEQSNR